MNVATRTDERSDSPSSVVRVVDTDSETDVDYSKRRFMAGVLSTAASGLFLLESMEAADAAEPTMTNTARPIEDGVVANTELLLSASTSLSSLSSSSLSSAAATATGGVSTGPVVDWSGILKKASKRALGGGKAGASAAVVQVCSLMWLRTAMNYQYRYGGNLGSSLSKLWEEGGISRLYQGLPFAIVQGPMTRFGDTAANVGVLALLESFDATSSLPLPIKTAMGSAAAGAWRIILMPIDTSKTAMQVEGAVGLQQLWDNVKERGPGALYRGAIASASATAVGHFPWFLTYNALNDKLPTVDASQGLILSLSRAAVLGLAASCVSDCCSNSLRVIKTTKQTASLDGETGEDMSYVDIVKTIIDTDGIVGLFGRGLQTRLLTNALQGAAFSVLWKYFQQTGGVQ